MPPPSISGDRHDRRHLLRRESVPRRLGCVLPLREPGLVPRLSGAGVDAQAVGLHVQHVAAVGRAVTGKAAPAAADREFAVLRAGELDGERHVSGVRGRTMSAGRRSTAALVTRRADSYS